MLAGFSPAGTTSISHAIGCCDGLPDPLKHATSPTPTTEKPMRPEDKLDPQTRLEVEAAAFRRLVAHFRERTDVQNIDLMNLAGFCRNCLSKWYAAAAGERGVELDYEEAREIVYGMPYAEWKARYQTDASAAQQATFDARAGGHD
jgi:hypothetical protein